MTGSSYDSVRLVAVGTAVGALRRPDRHFRQGGHRGDRARFRHVVAHRRRRAHPGRAGLCDGQVAEPVRDPAEVRALPRAVGAGHRRVLDLLLPRAQARRCLEGGARRQAQRPARRRLRHRLPGRASRPARVARHRPRGRRRAVAGPPQQPVSTAIIVLVVLSALEVLVLYALVALDSPLSPAVQRALHSPLGVAVLGGLKAGVTVAPLDPLLKPEERAEILADLEPALVLDEVQAERAEWTTRDAPVAPALVLYTSGSTGRPKGALLSHAAVDFAQRSWAGSVMALTPEDIVLAALPLSHSFGLNGALLAPLLAGARVRLVERFTPEGVADLISHERITVVPAVATMFRRLLEVLGFAGGPALRIAVSGAAPCPWDLVQEWRARTGVRIV